MHNAAAALELNNVHDFGELAADLRSQLAGRPISETAVIDRVKELIPLLCGALPDPVTALALQILVQLPPTDGDARQVVAAMESLISGAFS